MHIREQLESLVKQALQKVVASGTLELECIPETALERPRDEKNGDWACAVAMRCAKQAKKNPREVAQVIIEALPENDIIGEIEIAGPGFINFRLHNSAFQAVLKEITVQKETYGKGEVAEGERSVNLEYVSANPTGPMHVGHGRWAALGDAMARVMKHAGYEVYQEFYVNDAGVQMDLFGKSVACRYLQICGQDVSMPEDGYGGAYIKDIAQGIFDREGTVWVDVDELERTEAFREIAYTEMLQLMQDTLREFGNQFDCWFSERSLYIERSDGSTAVSRAFGIMQEKGFIYESEDASWFRSTEFGDEKDRVLIKENGEFTYFLSDIAYHYDKISRGFDHLIDIWGADHHGYVARCKAAMAAWGYPDTLEVVLGQLVNLFRGGETVRMSKRTGEMVTFKELVDEVGVDATRFLMLSRSSDQPIDFDIEVAKRKDATNPVYYVQYAHARICSILRKASSQEDADAVLAGEKNMDVLVEQLFTAPPDLSVLAHEAELALMRKMADFGDFIMAAARDRAPFRLTHYAQDLAALFHQFYTNCQVLGDDEEITLARLYLANSCRIVLAKTLDLLGVSAPIKM